MYSDKELNEFEAHGFPAKRSKLVVIADNLRKQVEALKKVAYHRNQHCEKCGHTWIEDGLNPTYCPYCALYEARAIITEIAAVGRYAIEHSGFRSTMTTSAQGGFVLWPDLAAILAKLKHTQG